MPENYSIKTLEYKSPRPPPFDYRPTFRPDPAVVPFLLLSVLLFLASLTQPAMYLDGARSGDRWECFLMLCIGWIGVFGGVFAWLANPALWLAWIFIPARRYAGALLLLMASLAFALSFLRETHWERDESGSHTATITGHGAGYWLWIASIAVALVGCAVGMARDRVRPSSKLGRVRTADHL